MLFIPLEKLAVPAKEALATLRPYYEALRAAAIRENDLRTFVAAELVLASMNQADYTLAQPYAYRQPAHYLKAEATDSVEDLYTVLQGFGYAPPCG